MPPLAGRAAVVRWLVAVPPTVVRHLKGVGPSAQQRHAFCLAGVRAASRSAHGAAEGGFQGGALGGAVDLMTGRMFRSGCFLQQLPHPGSIEKRTRSSAGGTPHSVASFSVLVSKWVRPSPKGPNGHFLSSVLCTYPCHFRHCSIVLKMRVSPPIVEGNEGGMVCNPKKYCKEVHFRMPSVENVMCLVVIFSMSQPETGNVKCAK